MRIHAAAALLPEGWARDVTVELEGGRLRTVTAEQAPDTADARVQVLVPGLHNVHSHAFQRGFAGLTEHQGENRDSFWTWREMMYRFALSISPDELEAIAALAYAEMLEAGFTHVGEFHYLHHAPDGQPYDNPAEMSARIFAAAQQTGIALTHLPVFYAHGGFGPLPATEGQRRFLHDLDSFQRLMEGCKTLLTRPQDRLGLAPHSLRGATAEEVRSLAEAFPGHPLHIHIAEQVKEVDDCLAHTGARPVEWLLANAPVGPAWCLVHATHLTPTEACSVAAAGAVVGLCPITEANLGDGIFSVRDFLETGGRFGVGTDSNVAISAAGELRLLEYSQRLATLERNVCAAGGSTGARLFQSALQGGAQAVGAKAPGIAAGEPADLVALRDKLDLDLAGDRLLDRWIFGHDLAVTDVWAVGNHVVQGGRHLQRTRIEQAAGKVLRRLI